MKRELSNYAASPARPMLRHTAPLSLGLLLGAIGVFIFAGTGIVLHSHAATSPSGVAVPIGDLPELNGGSWHEIFADDFNVNSTASDGQNWQSTSDGSKVVYTGTNEVTGSASHWTTYPENYTDTYQHRSYQSGQVLTTHDGVLDFYLHNVNGVPAGANPSPQLVGTSGYQTYGRYSVRIKTDRAAMHGYYVAWLLWPQLDSNYQCAESDYPEGSLTTSGTIGGFSHYGCAGAQYGFTGSANWTDWHTYTQEWGPGYRRYFIDGTQIGYMTNAVWSQPQRWQLQTETNEPNNALFQEGHLLVDWVAVYSYSPSPLASPSATPTALVGDVNGDGKVNIFDLSTLLSKWGTSDATNDLNQDGTINIFDLSTLLSHWTG